jgi:N-acetyl-beta-hexosaminidase
MKAAKLLLPLALFSLSALAETWSGTLVDVSCKGKDLAKHTKQCALGCAKSGYGVVLSDGKFVKFDEAGNAKAVEALKATAKEADLKVEVSGNLSGEVISVSSVKVL